MSSVTKINGPVSINVLRSPNNRVTFYLFGDSHFSREYGCDDANSIRMNYEGNDIERSMAAQSSNTIDIDAAFYLWLMCNNTKKLKTDLFLEMSYVPASMNKLKAIDWIDACERLKDQEYKFLPYCNVVPSDIRINNITNKSDILSQLHIELLTSSMLIKGDKIELMKVTQIIFASSMDIFDAYTQVNGLHKLTRIKSKISELNTSKVRDRFLHHLEKMEEDALLVGDNLGHLVPGHLVSKKLNDLTSFNDTTARIARTNLRYFRNKYKALSQELVQFNTDTNIAISVAVYGDVDKVIEMVLKARISSIMTVLVTMSSWIMDIYLITIAFLSRSTEKIIYAGNNHTLEYLDLLKKKHGYKHVVRTTNTSDQQRCLDAAGLNTYVNFGECLQ